MYRSATLKLTGWYLLILMSISILFSFVLYQVATAELRTRIGVIQEHLSGTLPSDEIDAFGERQLQQTDSMQISLVYANCLILAGGGIGSYLLARRTLRPIERSYEAQSRFTSDASHELRTPLTTMKTELEVALKSSSLTKAEMRELLTSNLEEVDRLSRLAENLLQLARLDNIRLQTERLDLGTLIREVTAKLDKDRRLSLELPSGPVYVNGNRIALEELVTILVDNALKHSPAKSAVRIRLSRHRLRASLSVINGGKGISSQDLPKIFDRFYRADSARSGGGAGGYGLGLPLAKKIVELHNGDLSASSAKDHDTTFTVQLPLAVRP